MKKIIMTFDFKIVFVFCAAFLISVSGCCSLQPDSVPVINSSSNWELELSCNYTAGCREVDVFRNDDISLLIDLDKGTVEKNVFTMSIMFLTPENETFSFNPNMSFVLINSKRINSIGFPCEYTEYGIETFKSGSHIKDAVKLDGYAHEKQKTRYTCFLLYFESLPPGIEDEFTIHIGELRKDSDIINIPNLNYSLGKRMQL